MGSLENELVGKWARWKMGAGIWAFGDSLWSCLGSLGFYMNSMKKMGVVFCFCWMMVVSLMAKGDDSFLIRMEGRVVRLSEFLWHFNRAGGGNDVNGYFDGFLRYHLKVADARRMQLDTLPDFRCQLDFLQNRVLKGEFMDSRLSDSYSRQLTDLLAARYVEKELVRVDVFTYRLSQHASATEEGNAVRVMDAWMRHLQKIGVPGEADLKWAKEHGIVQQFDVDEWTPANRLLKEILYRQANLSLGVWSELFDSPLGYHVVRAVERKHSIGKGTFAEVDRYMDSQGAASPAFDQQAYEAWKNDQMQLPADVDYRLTQAYEGLLSLYWDQHQNNAGSWAVSSKQLETYFGKHKDDYQWEYPHFKGAVVHCQNKKAASKIKKKLKKVPLEKWEETFRQLQATDQNYSGEITCGLFQIGKNPYVDRLAFKCGEETKHPNYPYTILIGKKLKKGPEDYTDVIEKVTEDVEKQHEKDLFSRLFARFNVEINKDVLKTVNSCGNK